jgi:DUF1009 family protein
MAGKLGIVAGGGRLPQLLIDSCRESGRDYFVLALRGQADPEAVEHAPHEWIRIGAAGRAFAILEEQGIEDLVLVGRVRRPSVMDLRPDLRAVKFFARLGLKGVGDDGLLRALIRELEEDGYRVVGVDDLLPALRAEEGVLGRHVPDAQAEADISRGKAVLAALASADVGQAVVVQQGIVLGVEKLSKHGQETRVDMPTIGPDTVSRAAEAGLRGIAIEAGATIVVDRSELVRAADRAGLFVLGINPD